MFRASGTIGTKRSTCQHHCTGRKLKLKRRGPREPAEARILSPDPWSRYFSNIHLSSSSFILNLIVNDNYLNTSIAVVQ